MEIEKKSYLDDYQIIKTLGQGYHAKVKLAIKPGEDKHVALKIFKKTHAFEKNKEALLKEFQSMQGLDHPNLIKLVAIKPDAQYKKKNGQVYNTMAIVLEYAGAGELFEYVSNCGRFDELTARTYFQQMVNGLQYIHNAGICHRDMKPENLLYDKDFILKIADFGFATTIAGKDGDGYLSTILGTESYMCPEIHQRVKYEGTSADLFAASIILFILFTGHPPFMKASPQDPYYKLLTVNKHNTFWKAHSKNKPGKENFFSDEIKNLFNTMFSYDPNNRASLEEVKSHAWFNGPTKTMDAIRQEFLQRQQVVEQELEAQRVKKQQEKAQQQGNYVFTGVGKFRSGTEVQDEFAGLENKYKNVNVKRNMRAYYQQPGKNSEFLTVIDPEYLLKLILKYDTKFCSEANLKDETYKIKCLYSDSNGAETKFVIEFLQKDQDTICVDFQKTSGSSIDYFTQVQKIKSIINNGSYVEENQQPQEQQA